MKQVMKADTRARAAGIKHLRDWLSNADLKTVRGKAIDQLPETERDGWRKLWADVANVLGPNSSSTRSRDAK